MRTYTKPKTHKYVIHCPEQTWVRLTAMAEANKVSVNTQNTACIENTWIGFVAETNEEMIGQVEDTNANL